MKKIPKTLQKFADKNDLAITILRFKNCVGKFEKGFSIHRKEKIKIDNCFFYHVVFEIKPVYNEWSLCTVPTNFENHGNAKRWFKRISNEMFKNIDTTCDSYMLLTASV